MAAAWNQPARPLPGPVLLPSLDARTLEQSMQAWAEQRAVVTRYIKTQMVEGDDYYTLTIGNRETKPTLSKAGSEKFLGLFQLHATFSQDEATWTMLGKPEGPLCYVCTLLTRSGEVIGEGRGARRVEPGQWGHQQGHQDGPEVGHDRCGTQDRGVERGVYAGSRT